MNALPNFTSKPVWELARHDGRLVAGEREYRGTSFFEVRLWTGEYGDKPTMKGVTIPPDAVRSLADAMLSYADRRDALDSPAI